MPASSVAPFSVPVPVPVTGLLSAWILLDEVADPAELVAVLSRCGVLFASIRRRPVALYENLGMRVTQTYEDWSLEL